MTRVMGLVNQIILTGEHIEDQRIFEKDLRIFPNKFEMVLTSILESKYLTFFFVEEMMGSLMSHETRIKLEKGSMQHSFKTQYSFSKGTGRGNIGTNQRGIGRGNQNAEERHTPEQQKHSKDSHNQRERGRK
jgi:hypothetical protein